MASPNVRASLLASDTYRKVPTVQRQVWLDYMEWLGPDSERPKDGEVFQDEKDCLHRLNAWGFREGCAYVIKTSRGTHATPNWDFACIFHDEKSQNNRKLQEDRVRKEVVDHKEQILSDRQRNTFNRRIGCPVQFHLSYSQVKRGHPERHFTGRWKVSAHDKHAIPVNPLSLAPHRQSLPELQQLKGVAQTYRFASLPYSEASKLLRDESLGMRLKVKEYYNLKRSQLLNPRDSDSALILLKALKDEGFHYRTVVKEDINSTGDLVSQQLVQIVFWHPEAGFLAQRFCAGHLLVVDATFNTNNLRMPLITSLGITNEGKALPVAFSYCPGETTESYNVFLRAVREDILGNEVAEIAVHLADMSSGMTSAVDNHGALSSKQQLQYCIFHAVEAIIARIRKGGYTSNEMENIQDLAWEYVKSPTIDALKTNRQALIDFVKPKEQEYIDNTWRQKEYRAIVCYTRRLPNLGCTATQRLESFHNIVHQVTHGQLSLYKSAHNLSVRLKEIYAERQEDEDKAWTVKATGLDTVAFKTLIGQISLLAIKLVEAEFLALMKEEVDHNPECDCENRLRYSLPCRHQLLPLKTGSQTQISLGLIHPRWWLNGPPAPRNWSPSWCQKSVILSPKKTSVYSDLAEIMAEREALSGEAQARFDRQIRQVTANMKQIAQSHRDLDALPLRNPEEIPKRTWLRKKPTENSRALTANELGQKQQNDAEKAQAQQARDQAILQQRQRQQKQEILSTVVVTPCVQVPQSLELQPLPDPNPLPPQPSPTLQDLLDAPPPSTAPAAITGEKRKRGRGKTVDYKALAGLKRRA